MSSATDSWWQVSTGANAAKRCRLHTDQCWPVDASSGAGCKLGTTYGNRRPRVAGTGLPDGWRKARLSCTQCQSVITTGPEGPWWATFWDYRTLYGWRLSLYNRVNAVRCWCHTWRHLRVNHKFISPAWKLSVNLFSPRMPFGFSFSSSLCPWPGIAQEVNFPPEWIAKTFCLLDLSVAPI